MMWIALLIRPAVLVALGVCLGVPQASAEQSVKDVRIRIHSPRRRRFSSPSISFSPIPTTRLCFRRAAWVAARIPVCRPRPSASATRSSTTIGGLIDYVSGSYGTSENELYASDVNRTLRSPSAARKSARRRSPRRCSLTSCKRPAASRRMSPPVITPSSSRSGARISVVPVPATAIARQATTTPINALEATASAEPNISALPRICWWMTSPGWRRNGLRAGRRGRRTRHDRRA